MKRFFLLLLLLHSTSVYTAGNAQKPKYSVQSAQIVSDSKSEEELQDERDRKIIDATIFTILSCMVVVSLIFKFKYK